MHSFGRFLIFLFLFEKFLFQVRISAACALASSSLRSHYGDEKLFSHVWKEVLVGLEKSEDLTDFTEFRHKDSLQFKVGKNYELISI